MSVTVFADTITVMSMSRSKVYKSQLSFPSAQLRPNLGDTTHHTWANRQGNALLSSFHLLAVATIRLWSANHHLRHRLASRDEVSPQNFFFFFICPRSLNISFLSLLWRFKSFSSSACILFLFSADFFSLFSLSRRFLSL